MQCLGYPGVHSFNTLPNPLWGLKVLKCKMGHWTDDLGACSNFNILQHYRDEEVPGRWVWCHPTCDLCSPPLILGGGAMESSPQKCFSNRRMEGRKVTWASLMLRSDPQGHGLVVGPQWDPTHFPDFLSRHWGHSRLLLSPWCTPVSCLDLFFLLPHLAPQSLDLFYSSGGRPDLFFLLRPSVI